MKLTIPLTGTVLREGSVWGKGKLKGAANDPIKPIPLNLGNVSWKMIDVDLENEVMVIDVQPAEETDEDTGQFDAENHPIVIRRPTTQAEKDGFLQYAKQLIEGHSKDELYLMSGCVRLKRPKKKAS